MYCKYILHPHIGLEIITVKGYNRTNRLQPNLSRYLHVVQLHFGQTPGLEEGRWAGKDYKLPNLGGYEFCSCAKRHQPRELAKDQARRVKNCCVQGSRITSKQLAANQVEEGKKCRGCFLGGCGFTGGGSERPEPLRPNLDWGSVGYYPILRNGH